MRRVFNLFVVTLVLSGCSLSAGADVGAEFGGRPRAPSSECDNFESCDIAYQGALASAQLCHEEGGDCDDEDHRVNASYADLREQTEMELAALRHELEERAAASSQPEQAPQAGRLENDCSAHPHPPDQPPAAHHGNGWFDSEPYAH